MKLPPAPSNSEAPMAAVAEPSSTVIDAAPLAIESISVLVVPKRVLPNGNSPATNRPVCSSTAPMSGTGSSLLRLVSPSNDRTNSPVRWSVVNGVKSLDGLKPMSISMLPGLGRCVRVGPPKLPRIDRFGSRITLGSVDNLLPSAMLGMSSGSNPSVLPMNELSTVPHVASANSFMWMSGLSVSVILPAMMELINCSNPPRLRTPPP